MVISLTAFWWKMPCVGSDCVKQNCPRQRAEPRRHIIDKVTWAAAEGCKLPNPRSLSIKSTSTACFWHGQQKKWGNWAPLLWQFNTQQGLSSLHMSNLTRHCLSQFSSPDSLIITAWRVGFSLGRHEAFVMYQDWPLLHRLQTKLESMSEQLRILGKNIQSQIWTL